MEPAFSVLGFIFRGAVTGETLPVRYVVDGMLVSVVDAQIGQRAPDRFSVRKSLKIRDQNESH